MASSSTATSDDWEYGGGRLLLAPMVRCNSLAFRTLCAEHGAHMVYSEELVDRQLAECRRIENEQLGTIDFESPGDRGGGRVVFRTVPGERVALQLGTADATQALLAAQKAAADVRAIDINMGCPVKFSVQGGMGSALLTQPEKVRDILTTLRRNLPASLAVTCKIRLLEAPHETLQLAKIIESCGVAALAVHARRKQDRPRFWAQWDQFRLLRESMPASLPLILNGDVFAPADVPRAFELTKADSLMLARGALWNPSIFRVGSGEAMATQARCVARYFELGELTGCPVGNLKYTAMLMLEGVGGRSARTTPGIPSARASRCSVLPLMMPRCAARAAGGQDGALQDGAAGQVAARAARGGAGVRGARALYAAGRRLRERRLGAAARLARERRHARQRLARPAQMVEASGSERRRAGGGGAGAAMQGEQGARPGGGTRRAVRAAARLGRRGGGHRRGGRGGGGREGGAASGGGGGATGGRDRGGHASNR